MADFDKVLKCWPAIEADPETVGGEVLNWLISEYPETRKEFPKFDDIPTTALASHPAVKKHGGVVVRKLGEILKAKGDHKPIVKHLATTHATIHKISLRNYKLLKEALVKVFGEKGLLDAEGQAGLGNVMDMIISETDDFYKELGVQE